MPPKVSIIILNWNGLKDTIECLESLKKITYPNYEVILVDNGSKGNDADILENKYKNYIKLIRNKRNLGFAEGNNVAIREVIKEGKSDYILLLNNDTEIEANFLEELVKCAKEHPGAGSIQPKIILAKDRKLIDSVGIEYSKNGLAFNRGFFEPVEKYDREEEIFGCCAGACLYRVDALKDVEFDDEIFDKDFFAQAEDTDLALRLQWAGWKSWYVPKAIVYHLKGGSVGIRSNFTIYHGGRNLPWVLTKNLPPSFIFKNFLSISLAEIGQIGLNLLRGKPIILKAKLDAILNLGKFLKKRRRVKKQVRFPDIEKWFVLKWRTRISPFYTKNSS